VTIDRRFSRAAFETSLDPSGLACELSVLLGQRLEARPSVDEATQIVKELQSIGHDLRCWDESTDFAVWISEWEGRRVVLTCRYSDPDSIDDDDAEPHASFEFGPVPKNPTSVACPECAVPMKGDFLRLDIAGHGGVQYESLPYRLTVGPDFQKTGAVRNQSIGVQANVLRCSKCGGIWFRPRAKSGA
jgi:hypothetical protein